MISTTVNNKRYFLIVCGAEVNKQTSITKESITWKSCGVEIIKQTTIATEPIAWRFLRASSLLKDNGLHGDREVLEFHVSHLFSTPVHERMCDVCDV